MKRKVKKYGVGGETEYDQEDTGLFGGKIKYRVDKETGNKYVAGKANPFDRNPAEQRYYSINDVKGKLGMGSKEDSKPTETYIDKQMKRAMEMPDITPEPPKGIASGFKSDQSVFERNDNEVKMPSANKKPSYKNVSSPKETGSQNSTTKSKSSMDVSSPGARMMEKNVRIFKEPENSSYKNRKTGLVATDDEVYKRMKEKNKASLLSSAENRAKSSTSLKAPGSKMDMNDPYSMTLGGDLDPRAMMRRNSRLSGDIDFKKGGVVKKMASGGKAKSASARADGCAIRGKTRA